MLKKFTQRHFKENLKTFDRTASLMAGVRSVRKFARVCLAMTLKYIKPSANARLVDFCCGGGQFIRLAEKRGFLCTGVDFSSNMLREARKLNPTTLLIKADVTRRDFPECAEAATCFFGSLNSLGDSSHVLRALKNVKRTLAPGGIFLFDVMNRSYLTEMEPVNRSTPIKLTQPKGGVFICENKYKRGKLSIDFIVNDKLIGTTVWNIFSEAQWKSHLRAAGFKNVFVTAASPFSTRTRFLSPFLFFKAS